MPSCNFLSSTYRWVSSKEYISLVEWIATPHCLKKSQLTQPLPACSVGSYTDGQVVLYTADRAGRGWVSWLFVRRWGAAVRSTSDIYSLVSSVVHLVEVWREGDGGRGVKIGLFSSLGWSLAERWHLTPLNTRRKLPSHRVQRPRGLLCLLLPSLLFSFP